MFALTLAGVLFSGFLSAKKLFTGVCAFNESCPYFLGYPACWYGFGMFLVMFLAAVGALLGKLPVKSARTVFQIISLLGILFAGQFVVGEIYAWQSGSHFSYALGLPTCVYGLIFYIAIFVISFWKLRETA